MKLRTIQQIEKGHPIKVGTASVQELLPAYSGRLAGQEGFFDPFLVFHHAHNKADETVPIKQQGVPPHPHRGFSPVSFIYKGGVFHRDSRGNKHNVYAGGTQWMNTGMGVVHSERIPEDIFEHGGVQELLQIWINTPAQHKMDQPAYYPATKEDTPTVVSNDGLITLRVPAGRFENVKGNIPTMLDVTTIMGEARQSGTYTFTFPERNNTLLYVLGGKLLVNGETVLDNKQLALFNNDGETFTISALEDTQFFVGSGEPINEPIEARGPFVMNTSTEIMEAYRDYQMGKMGVLIED